MWSVGVGTVVVVIGTFMSGPFCNVWSLRGLTFRLVVKINRARIKIDPPIVHRFHSIECEIENYVSEARLSL